MYSANEAKPNPAGHFNWLDGILTKIEKTPGASGRIKLANNILEWGGMQTRLKDDDAGHSLINAVVDSARQGAKVQGAPMNSSYTKVAAVFGYANCKNTIWDSRVSSAICFRLACLLANAGDGPDVAKRLFPGLGFVAGVSKRVEKRMSLVGLFWPNVYQKWSGHFAGADLIREIAVRLNARGIHCPEFGGSRGAGPWTPWKVNMVFFADDITACPSASDGDDTGPDHVMVEPAGRGRKPPPPRRATAAAAGEEPPEDDPAGELCHHQIVNYCTAWIHFEPACIACGDVNSASNIDLPKGKHGLGDYRLLLEFYRLSSNNCKISARVRVADPAFDKLSEAAAESDCPQKKEESILVSRPAASSYSLWGKSPRVESVRRSLISRATLPSGIESFWSFYQRPCARPIDYIGVFGSERVRFEVIQRLRSDGRWNEV